MKNKILKLSILFVLILSISIYSCGKSNSYSSSTAPTPNSPSYGSSNAVSIVNMSFSPASITVKTGAKVTWANNDGMTHTTTSDNADFDSGNITTGSKFSEVFSKEGTYTYHCSIHPGMKGTIVVKY